MPEPPTRRWTVLPSNQPLTDLLAQTLPCPTPVAALLVARGITSELRAKAFLNPTLEDLLDPRELLGLPQAVTRIQRALAAGEKILIYGDYDVDGTVATVLLKTALERTAPTSTPAQVTFHVPHRIREGYGMQTGVLGLAAGSGVTLVISVDTGIRAFAAAAEAKALGLDLIVTDHHLPDDQHSLPEALAVINPAQPGCPYPNKALCGAGVAFKLAEALLAASPRTRSQLPRLVPSFLKLLAIATIADSVPLTGENRAMVALGLRELANPIQPGLRALMQVAEIPLNRPPTASEVGFRLAPRINAAGRMDVASDVVDLFLTRDPALAETLAKKLDALNQDRRATEAQALDAIELQLLSLLNAAGDYPPHPIVLGHPEWHRGVLGILASRVVERTNRPALILTEDAEDAHGSGRSIPGFHLLDALTAAHSPALFHRFGGHAHAVGFSLPATSIDTLRQRLHLQSLTPELLIPELTCDVELAHEDLNADLIAWLARLAPFGNSHPEPVFLVRSLLVAGPARIIKDRHVCLPVTTRLGQALNAMGWSRTGATPWSDRCAALTLTPGSLIDAVFRLRENLHPQYGGLELELLDLRCDLTCSTPASEAEIAASF